MISLLFGAFLQMAAPAVPPNAHVLSVTEGVGVQIYRCTQGAAGFAWKFEAPEAALLDPVTGLQKGSHGAGPSWTWLDGSSITGKVLGSTSAADPASIPTLLLAATPSGPLAGSLSLVSYVTRTETHGGVAPQGGCDASHGDAVVRVPYTARYTFYVVAKVPGDGPQETH